MNPKSPGLWLLITHGRAQTNLPRFLRAAIATGVSTPGAIIVDRPDFEENESAYRALDLPDGWFIHVVEGGSCAEATEQAKADLFNDETQWIGWLADDLMPETMGWDVQAIEMLNGWNCVSTDDGAHAPQKFNGATVWSGDLLRAIGYFYPEGMKHWYIDTIIEELGKRTGCWHVNMDVMVRHKHAAWVENKDATYARTNRYWTEDDRAFLEWQRTEMSRATERILALMEAKGVKMIRPKLHGIKLMIATPCGDGRYERVFMDSLIKTRDALMQYGAEVHFAEIPYVSDITLARNKMFGAFLRSDDTHMLMIDSDQGWRVQDAVKLLLANQDFVAAAGIRKVFPSSFAVNVSDDMGRPIPIKQDAKTGFLEATGVGMAFTLLSRSAVEKMVASYQDLIFVAADGREEYGVFNPLIVNRRYLSEDYAFCHRWRQIGGRILIDPAISLQHVGAFCWEGDWLTQLVEKATQEQAA